MIQIVIRCDEDGCTTAHSTSFDSGEETFFGLLSSLEENGWVIVEPERAGKFKEGLQEAVRLRCPIHDLVSKITLLTKISQKHSSVLA